MTTVAFRKGRETGRHPLSPPADTKPSWRHSAGSRHSPGVASSWLSKAPATLSWLKIGEDEQHPPLHALCLRGISPRNAGIKNTTSTNPPLLSQEKSGAREKRCDGPHPSALMGNWPSEDLKENPAKIRGGSQPVSQAMLQRVTRRSQ